MRSVPVVAVALRELRRGAGLSQEQLAERAGVTERTVRALESGATARPRRDTLDALGLALGLGSQARRDFVASWGEQGKTLSEMLTHWTPDQELQTRLRAQRLKARDLGQIDVAVLGPTGHLERWTTRTSFEVLQPGLDGRSHLMFNAPDRVRSDALRVTDVVNAEVDELVLLTEPGVVGVEARFGRELSVGQWYSYGYTIDYSQAYVSEGRSGERDVHIAEGFSVPTGEFTLDVQFHADLLPTRVVHTGRDTLDGAEQDLYDVALSPFGSVQLHLRPVPVGVWGLRWEWD